MTKIKNRNSLVKTTPKNTRKGKRKKNNRSPLSKAVVKNLKSASLIGNGSPEKSLVVTVINETLNFGKSSESPDSGRYSVQDQENFNGNGTINLEDEDSFNKNHTSPEKEQSPSTSKSDIVIDICENSVTDGDLVQEPEIIEIKNTTTEDSSVLIDLSTDDNTNYINQDPDDIVILHAKCTPPKDEIEIISHNKLPKKKYEAYLKSNKNKNGEKQIKKIASPNLKLNIENNSLLDFIPLDLKKNSGKNLNNFQFNNPLNPSYCNFKEKPKNKRLRKKMKKIKRLSENSLSPKSKVQAIGSNIYSEKPFSVPSSGLRPIIIDGSNVAFDHSKTKPKQFSCKGLEICINYFKEKGHKVTAFVPQIRMKLNYTNDQELLNKLVDQGDVILTPSRIVDGKPIVSYDDRFIVQTAALKGGIIVTRDNYKDLLSENPAWRDTINYRILQYTWVDDVLMFPNDPLGCRGPSLEKFLRF